MNIRKMLEEVEPVICDVAPEPTVYDMLVFYYLQFSAFSKAEAHRCASKYIDELLKRADYIPAHNKRTSGMYPMPSGLVAEEERVAKCLAAERERLTMNGKPKGDFV
jgi:hypothetical protein